MARFQEPILFQALCCLMLASGCTETPLDATLIDFGSEPTDSNPVSLCPTAVPVASKSYHLVSKSSGACLGLGTVTQIELATSGATGYTVELFVSCLDIPEQRWRLLATGFGEWNVENEASGLNLDLEGARTSDGTEALLYDPHGLNNQRFAFSLQSENDFRIQASTLLTTNSCLEAMSSGEDAVTLQGCSDAVAQLWLLSEPDC